MFKIIKTDNSVAALIMRLALGSVMFVHGLQQVFGLFNGTTFSEKVAYYSSLGVPSILGACGVLTVTVGAALLIVGLWGRLMSFFILAFVVTAMMLIHIHNGFFMNWEGQKVGEGFEYHILAIGLAVGVMILGSGAASIDRLLTLRKGE